MKTFIGIVSLFAIVLSINSAAVAQQSNESRTDVPRAISYQAVLTDASGVPAPDGDYTIGASIYDVVGDRSLWHDTFRVHSTRGVINLLLGSGTTPLPDLTEVGTLWLGIRIDGGEELPLAELTPAPYALTVPNGAISTDKIANGAITSEKMGADYIGSISINGQRFSTRGSDVNIITGDGMLATVDQATNSIMLSATGASSSLNGKGANSQNSNTSYIINQYGTSNIQTNATFDIDGSGAVGQSATGSHTFTVGTAGNPAASTFNGNVIVSGTHTLSVGGTSSFTGNVQMSNGLTVANAPFYSDAGSYLSSTTYIHASSGGSGSLLLFGSTESNGLYPIVQGVGNPYWDGSTIQNANVSGDAFGITDQLAGDVNGNYYENFVNGINGIQISSTAPTNGQVLNYDSTNGDIEWTSGAGFFIQNGTSLQSNANFNISGNGYIGGNVGIGTTTPQAPLDVNGFINTDSSYKIGGSTVLTATNYSGTAANATKVATTLENGVGTVYPVFVPNASTGNQLPGVNSGLAYNTSTNTLTATNFAGTATNATNVATTVENGVGTVYPVFVPNASTANQLPGVNSGLAYNTSTSTLTATNFAGTATNATNVATTIENGVGTVYPVFVPNASTANQLPGVNSGLAYNTSTSTLTATNFAGTATNATNVVTTIENGVGTVYPVFVPNASTANQLPGVNSGLAYNTSTSTLTATNFAGTATNATNVATTIENSVGTVYPVFVPNPSTGNQLPGVNSGLAYNTSTGTLFAGTFSGGLGSFSSSTSASALTASNRGAQSASITGETISNTATLTSEIPFQAKIGLAIIDTGDWNSDEGNLWGLTLDVNAGGGGVSTTDDIVGTGQNWVVTSAGAAGFSGGINVASGGSLPNTVTNTVVFNDDQAGYLTTAHLSLPQTWTLPNKTGTLALTSDITGGALAGSFSSSTSASALTASNKGAQSTSITGETISNTATLTSEIPFQAKIGLAIIDTGDWNSDAGNLWGLTLDVNAGGGGVSTTDDIVGTGQNWVVTSAGAAGFSGGINVASGGSLPNTVTNTVVFNDDQAGYLTTAHLSLPQTWSLPNNTGTLALTTDITGGSLAGSFTTLTVGNSSALQVDASGDLTSTGSILANATGSTSSAPRVMGFSNTGFASLHLGDQYNTIQSASGDRTQVTSYWGLELYGHAYGSVPSFVTGSSSDPDVNIIGTSIDAPQLRVTRGGSGQTSALQQWTSETGSVLASVNNVGEGTFTAIAGKVNASVNLSSAAYTVATSDMTLIVTTGSATHDILLPDPAPAGRIMTIKNTDTLNGVVISAGSHSIDKTTTLSLAAFGASGVSGCIIIGDGTNWWIFGEH